MDGSQIDAEHDIEFLRDNDSIYALPLRYVPLETVFLRRGRLVKTFPLESAVEIIKYEGQGMGFFYVDDLMKGDLNEKFGWDDGAEHPDAKVLKVLSELDSFDIYNLRIKFRQHDIGYEGFEYLTLSPELQRELRTYMNEFTAPLIRTVFGEDAAASGMDGDIVSLLRNPDTGQAMQNLQRLSDKLYVDRAEIPQFLEEFSEVYLAVSYYKRHADQIRVLNGALISELEILHRSLDWKHDPKIEHMCREVGEYLKALLFLVYAKLDRFDAETRRFWVNINPDRFRDLQALVRESQETIAGVLCGLSVKLSRWREQFPTAEHGAAERRYEVLKTEIRPGMGRLMALATGEADFLRIES